MNEIIDSKDIPLYHTLSDHALACIKETLTLQYFKKDTLLIKETTRELNAYIIKKGIARGFITTPEQEITFWFAREGDIMNSTAGYFYQTKGYENFHLLEDCILLQINMTKMRILYETNLEISNWSRTITESEAIKSEKRHLDYILLSAEERYLGLLTSDAGLFKRVQLKDIASYLGISPVSLSRIRSRLKN